MYIEKVETEEEYEAALNKVSAMMNWSPHTEEEYAEMDRLVTMIEEYERVHYPI